MVIICLLVLIVLCALIFWRFLDHLADRREMARLAALQPSDPAIFDAAMVDDLPEPARRFFRFAIAEGTPLLPVVDLKMSGQFSLGTKEAPKYMDMQAHQVLAAPHGFVWKMSGRSGVMSLSGSDAAGWTRFWLAGVLPVARFGGTSDHSRAAFGRYVAEAVFWAPAAVLPGPNVSWEGVSANRAAVTLRHGALAQTVEVSVAADGRPTQVVFPRWSDANPEKKYRLQMFGGYLSAFKEVQGYRVPTHVEAGNFFGSDAYFPFFIADVNAVSYPSAQ